MLLFLGWAACETHHATYWVYGGGSVRVAVIGPEDDDLAEVVVPGMTQEQIDDAFAGETGFSQGLHDLVSATVPRGAFAFSMDDGALWYIAVIDHDLPAGFAPCGRTLRGMSFEVSEYAGDPSQEVEDVDVEFDDYIYVPYTADETPVELVEVEEIYDINVGLDGSIELLVNLNCQGEPQVRPAFLLVEWSFDPETSHRDVDRGVEVNLNVEIPSGCLGCLGR